MSVAKKIPLDAPMCMRFLHQEYKFTICVIRRYAETKKCPVAVFPTTFVTGIRIKKKQFFSFSKPKI